MQDEIGQELSIDRLAQLLESVGARWHEDGPKLSTGEFHVTAASLDEASSVNHNWTFSTSSDLIHWVQRRKSYRDKTRKAT